MRWSGQVVRFGCRSAVAMVQVFDERSRCVNTTVAG